jgi:hypothetical protein
VNTLRLHKFCHLKAILTATGDDFSNTHRPVSFAAKSIALDPANGSRAMKLNIVAVGAEWTCRPRVGLKLWEATQSQPS